ncbi:MAG: 4-deoxy-4-formamido-L-arabinose-phosphoundecaprenol deformylase [Verrucomicrobiales bacterium]|nr:4-deoxy-4-formamido-L-arabinose-phosphoundecaprenol deformylase [Verrucomicrobiales bacterium]
MGRLAIKVDAATDRGTRQGVAPLARLFREIGVPALFCFALGPDRLGRSVVLARLRRWWRRGSGVSGWWDFGPGSWRNGILRPGPPLGRCHGALMRQVRDAGFEVGLGGHDADRWRRRVHRVEIEFIRADFNQALAEFQRVFGGRPRVAAAPDWQCNARTLRVCDEARLLFATDTRGQGPFLPVAEGRHFRTPQIPTTLPPLDEVLIRRSGSPEDAVDGLVERILGGGDELLTVRAEVEGLRYPGLLERLLRGVAAGGAGFWSPVEEAAAMSDRRIENLPRDGVELLPVPGRPGRVAFQASAAIARPAKRWQSAG